MKSKKLLAMLMAVVMSLAVAAPAMATDYSNEDATLTSNSDTSSYDVKAKATVDRNTVNEYESDVEVKVEWDAETGVYNAGTATYTWDAETKKYTREAKDLTETTAPAMTITLTNNSNMYENYKIAYTKTVNEIEENPADGSSTEGTLASYTAVNAVIPQDTTGSTTANSNMQGKNTATYSGTFAANSGLTLTGTEAVTVGTYKVTLSEATTAELTYTFKENEILSAAALLNSEGSVVTYTDDQGKNCIAYNGYISETAYANWYDAMTFVQMLNENGVVPGESYRGNTGGYWRLLGMHDDFSAWRAQTSEAGAHIESIVRLWSSGENDYDPSKGGYGHWGYGTCSFSNKSTSDSEYGFVVVWAQN